jgi:hypothetical protein
LRVLVIGLGLALPIISLITLFNSYSMLVDNQATSWDEDQENVVVHRPAGVLQAVLAVIGFAAVIAIIGYGVMMRFTHIAD